MKAKRKWVERMATNGRMFISVDFINEKRELPAQPSIILFSKYTERIKRVYTIIHLSIYYVFHYQFTLTMYYTYTYHGLNFYIVIRFTILDTTLHIYITLFMVATYICNI